MFLYLFEISNPLSLPITRALQELWHTIDCCLAISGARQCNDIPGAAIRDTMQGCATKRGEAGGLAARVGRAFPSRVSYMMKEAVVLLAG